MLIPNFEMLLQEGSMIIILSKFGIAENNGKYRVIKHQHKLNRKTIVKKSQDFLGPMLCLDFVLYPLMTSLTTRLVLTFVLVSILRLFFLCSKPVNDFSFYLLIIYVSTDVIGNVVECGDINLFSRNGKESKRISLQLENV